MRVLIRLKALRSCAYDLRYHHKLQGFIYGALKGTDYSELHNKKGYKFFSYSNIFPARDIKEDEERNLLVASPDERFIRNFLNGLWTTGDGSMNVGEMSFKITDAKILNPRIDRNTVLETATPVIIRIPKENYEKYGITPPKDYPYFYWRKEYPFNAFLKQVEENLIKKYNEYQGTTSSEEQFFEQFIFKKQVCNHITMKNKEIKLIGSIWQFPFNHVDGEKSGLVQFALDTGLGELNSLGFGFINLTMKKDYRRH